MILNILSLILPHKAINKINTVFAGKNMHVIELITKKGPKGIYSSLLFKIAFRTIKTTTETMAPTKNDSSAI